MNPQQNQQPQMIMPNQASAMPGQMPMQQMPGQMPMQGQMNPNAASIGSAAMQAQATPSSSKETPTST